MVQEAFLGLYRWDSLTAPSAALGYLVLIRDIPNGRVVPPAVTPASPEAVPEYYVALPGADNFATMSWTAGGRGLAIGYTWSAKSGQYLGVRTLDVTRPGHDLVADSRVTWSVKSLLNPPATYPLTCAMSLRVVVAPDGTVVCGAAGVLRAVTRTFSGPVCPAIRPWNAAGFLEYSTVTGALARTVYGTNSSCVPGGDDVLWASASGRTVIGYIQYGLPPLTKTSILRFGAFGDGRFTPLPVPPTTTTTPNAIAW